MGSVNSILDQRMKKPANTSKMAAMAMQSASGNLTSFSGIFRVMELSEQEKNHLLEILKEYGTNDQDFNQDLGLLISLTSEVKAINNQAALLHGERIKRAQLILTQYRDGAFTAWLMSTYGNRQTPYNFMQYYEFCEAMPQQLRRQIEIMPRQAVYVLASRAGSIEKKQDIVENYQGENKFQLLTKIRQIFPLPKTDKRQTNTSKSVIVELHEIYTKLKVNTQRLTENQKKQIFQLTSQIQHLIGTS